MRYTHRETALAAALSLGLLTSLNAEAAPRHSDEVSGAESLGYALGAGFQERPEDQPAGSFLATTLAIVPGIILHGTGHYVSNDKDAAWRLFFHEIGGLALTLGGYFLEKSTNNSGETAAASRTLMVTGMLLNVGSWVADIVGSYRGAQSFSVEERSLNDKRFGLAYRYTSDPLNPFRHHIVARLDLNFPRFYLRPSVDLEASTYAHRMQLDLGGYIYRNKERPQNALAIGARFLRVGTPSYGLASMNGELYMSFKRDVGTYIKSMRGFYVVTHLGYGLTKFQFSETENEMPGFFSKPAYSDSFLVLKAGFEFNFARHTMLDLLFVQDPTHDVAPFSTDTGLFEAGIVHRYSENLDIELDFTGGDGWVLWLGLGYAL